MEHVACQNLTVLIRVHDGRWAAQCVEYDIAVQGKDLDDVLYSFESTLLTQVAIDIEHGIEPLSEVPPAPEVFWKIARSAAPIKRKMPRFQSSPETAGKVRSFKPRKRLMLCPA